MSATARASNLGVKDDWVTVCAISTVAGMIADVLHEGVGHALVALLTVAPSGTLSTVAWSSAYDSKLVAAGGTLVNLASGGMFWFLLEKYCSGRAAAARKSKLGLDCPIGLQLPSHSFSF